MGLALTIGFVPLVDACLPILAREHGFAEDEGVAFDFVKDLSWAAVLDRLLYGHSDAAHMVAPLAIATTLGRGRPAQPLSVPFVLGLNGNAITLRTDLAAEVAPAGRLGDPAAVGAALKQVVATRKLRFGVVHRYSSHNYMLRYWLATCGVRPDQDVEIVTVPPPFCADALEAGEVDGICVGEPWNSVAVERGVGQIVLATAQIWRRGVEKVLALREPVLEDKREAVVLAIRAMIRAGRHFVDPANWDANAAILARAEYLDGNPAIIKRAIADRLLLSHGETGGGGEIVAYPDFMFQYREAANFPWVSQAEWLYTQMVRWDGLEYDSQDAAKAARVFRPDVYRGALIGTGEPLPGANSKVEGSLGQATAVGTQQGRMTLESNRFFDGRSFDPADIPGYLASLP
ncbi:MAG: CmpA/NrtA family ABC transporter substrate-binding protein [Novosphingobium sp.]